MRLNGLTSHLPYPSLLIRFANPLSRKSTSLTGRKETPPTRLRINLTGAIVFGVASTAYFARSQMQEELFQHHWARPCPKYDGAVIWCINETRKTSEPFHGRINRVSRRGPDCQQVEENSFHDRCPL